MNMGCCNGGYHEFNLDWFLKRFKEVEEEWNGTKEWLENWVDSFDISDEVKKVLQGWVNDGTFERLINEVVLNDINEKVVSLEQELDTEKGNIKENTADIAKNTADITELKTRKPINMLGKRFILLADSYGEYSIFDGFINVMQGARVESSWVGGAGFTKTGEQSFLTMLNALPNHNDVDYVVVFGLYNDSFDVNNLVAKILEFKNRAIEKYPGAELVIVNQGWSKDVSLQGQFQYLINTVTNGFAISAVTTIHTWKFLHVYSRIANDKIHPASDSVGRMLGSLAAKILLGGNLNFCYPIVQITPTYINGWQAYSNTSAPYQEMNDSECLLHFVSDINHYGIDAGTTIKCNGSNYVEIMRFPNDAGCIIGSGDMLLNIPCILGLTNGTYRQGSCTLELYDSKLRIRPFLLNTAGSDFETIKLNSIQWTPCTIRSNINHI